MSKMQTKDNIQVGEIRYADLSPAFGNEMGGIRPVLIEEMHPNVVIVVPYGCNFRTNTYEPLYEHIRSVDYRRIKGICDIQLYQ